MVTIYRWPPTVSQEFAPARTAFFTPRTPVFVTTYRHRVFTAKHLVRLEETLRDVCADVEVELIEFNGEGDHIHMLVHFPPKVSLAKLVNSLKGGSSRWLRQEFPDLVQHYWRAQKPWSPSYVAASLGGAPLDTAKKYIENQSRPSH